MNASLPTDHAWGDEWKRVEERGKGEGKGGESEREREREWKREVELSTVTAGAGHSWRVKVRNGPDDSNSSPNTPY